MHCDICVYCGTVTHGGKGNGNDPLVIYKKGHPRAHSGRKCRKLGKTAHSLVHTLCQNAVARTAGTHPKLTLNGSR